ncbi:aldo/keto reductase [Colletotrichum graminicola]|uniref:Aldo/keto reductase n=1 Tax=Colletotrichum graminicola (strain M1.001 / M2 / FGSC 10212) TaxID=645133 RepID=E3QVI7_COLGM|nr:aldo/keto reductase [Colletotrichum graminicola M1.001]EFQ34875.1 aldo/keto reductase [Colletotrichum graminicola M1.001]WDK12931.1 aldo/keto reductase [Colletotrichum graminicola]
MSARSEAQSAKTAHVNMMTDTIITNLPAENLRVIMRSLLAAHPDITSTFEAETRNYIQDVAVAAAQAQRPANTDITWLQKTQATIRCMLGCGLCSQSIPLMNEVVAQGVKLLLDPETTKEDMLNALAAIDGDIVQIMTAFEKTLLASSRTYLLDDERTLVTSLHENLVDCRTITDEKSLEYPYGRALFSTSMLLGLPLPTFDVTTGPDGPGAGPVEASETFEMNGRRLPRVFTGLWQMSSPSWGAAPSSNIIAQFSKYLEAGMSAFDMADHYGDAEVIFGRFRSSYPFKNATFAATKYCVFNPMKVTRAAVEANIAERCRRLQSDKIDLLQFHWQFYNDPQYLEALRLLEEDPRITNLGLCNFDTEHLEAAIAHGIKVRTNQVQFSLIDSRPIVKMGKICEKNDIKLLTYGTLCGGFLAEKWLGKGQPDLYDAAITPSQRKYYAMIRSWGGWELFQDLLRVLKNVAAKYGVSVSNVATRWVLDFPYVGAVIVGARMGISEHTDENLASLGWTLQEEDREAIEEVLKKSRRLDMFEAMGDCGGEYR